jgi:hypothetical protein
MRSGLIQGFARLFYGLFEFLAIRLRNLGLSVLPDELQRIERPRALGGDRGCESEPA